MFCKQCGKENDDNLAFCVYCGAATAPTPLRQAPPKSQSALHPQLEHETQGPAWQPPVSQPSVSQPSVPQPFVSQPSAREPLPSEQSTLLESVPIAESQKLGTIAVSIPVPRAISVGFFAAVLIILAGVAFCTSQVIWPFVPVLGRSPLNYLVNSSVAAGTAFLLILIAALGQSFSVRLRRSYRLGKRYRLDATGDTLAAFGLLLHALAAIIIALVIEATAARAMSEYSAVISVVRIAQSMLPLALFAVAAFYYFRPVEAAAQTKGVARGLTLTAAFVLLGFAAVEVFQFILPTLIGQAVTSTANYQFGHAWLEVARAVAVLLFFLLRGLYWLIAPALAKKLPVR